MGMNLLGCLGLFDSGQYKSTNILPVLVPQTSIGLQDGRRVLCYISNLSLGMGMHSMFHAFLHSTIVQELGSGRSQKHEHLAEGGGRERGEGGRERGRAGTPG